MILRDAELLLSEGLAFPRRVKNNIATLFPEVSSAMNNSSAFEQLRTQLAEDVKRVRTSRSLSQETLALKADVDRTYVSQIERAIANPSIEVLSRLAATLNVTMKVILDQDDLPTSKSNPAAVKEAPRGVLAANLVRLRKERGWSQEELAFEAGLHRTFVGHVERQIRNISLDNIERLASALGSSVHQLLTPLPSDA